MNESMRLMNSDMGSCSSSFEYSVTQLSSVADISLTLWSFL